MIDEVTIFIEAGFGGDGSVSFRREKFVPRGGPDGGHGGDVWISGDQSLNTLLHLSYTKVLRARGGKNGSGGNRRGASGADLDITVPLGTVIWRIVGEDKRVFMMEVLGNSPQLLLEGGYGGRGNASFSTPVNQAPILAECGTVGQKAKLLLELKLVADVGIVGLPNAGKSTMVSSCSAAVPKIADYPFTTLDPVLGVVDFRESPFVLMEVPGLIEGAHMGVGLGSEFLRHAERARILWHMVDGLSDDLIATVEIINNELRCFSPSLYEKPMIIVLNKIDVPEALKHSQKAEKMLKDMGYRVFLVSAATREGMDELLETTIGMLAELNKENPAQEIQMKPLKKPPSINEDISITRLGDGYVVHCPRIERIVARVDTSNPRVTAQIWAEFLRLGLDNKLVNSGVKPGDTIRIGNIDMEWK
jgi:GTP-binding protein